MNCHPQNKRDHTPPSGIGGTFTFRGWDDGSGDRNLGGALFLSSS